MLADTLVHLFSMNELLATTPISAKVCVLTYEHRSE
jgi:hypothetical protein